MLYSILSIEPIKKEKCLMLSYLENLNSARHINLFAFNLQVYDSQLIRKLLVCYYYDRNYIESFIFR